MPAPLARGIIIAASVIVAAGIAAYEHPQVREWLDRSREKIAVAFKSTLDDIRPPRPRRDDPSMREDQDEKAEERRRQARQEILERGMKLEELRRKRSTSSDESADSTINEKRTPSFDTLVDEDGKLRGHVQATTAATSSAIQPQDPSGTLRSRHTEHTESQPLSVPEVKSEPQSSPLAMHQSVDAPMLLRQLDQQQQQQLSASAIEPWESQYEREMRETFNMPYNAQSNRTPTASTHPSESLVELTPRTEDVPDPDYSIPSGSETGHPLDRTEYFSIPPTSRTQSRAALSRTMSVETSSDIAGPDVPDLVASSEDFYYAHPSAPSEPLRPRPISNGRSAEANSTAMDPAGSSAVSVAGSDHSYLSTPAHAILSDFELSSDDGFSEIGDGIRTPASAWTDVGSTTSSVAGDRL